MISTKQFTSSTSIIEAEDLFFNKEFYMSYSSLRKLIYCPKLFYDYYVLKQREDKIESHLLEGRLVHCLLLEPEKFNDNFLRTIEKLPSDSVKKVIDYVFKQAKINNLLDTDLEFHRSEILQGLQDCDLYQKIIEDDLKISKVVTESGIAYYNYLKNKESKTLVSSEEYNSAQAYVEVLESDPEISEFLKLYNVSSNIIVEREKLLTTELSDYEFGLKGYIDSIVINHENHTIDIQDLKTTSKTIDEFPGTIDFYGYWLQAAIYYIIVSNVYKDLNYEIKFSFVVIDKYKQSYIFEVSKESMRSWINKSFNEFNKANFHFLTKNFSLPYLYLKNKIML